MPDILVRRKIDCEKDLVEALILELMQCGYHVRRNRRLRFGSIDLLAWNDLQIVVFEVKYGAWKDVYVGCFHDILQGLGQLLSYREQFKLKKGINKPVRYVLYSNAELEFDKEYKFLKALCAKYDVILHMPLVELVKYL